MALRAMEAAWNVIADPEPPSAIAQLAESDSHPPFDRDPRLRERVTGALRWSFINSAVLRLSQLGVGIVLAHLIAPRQFGVYAVALVVVNIVLSVSELGVSVALVRHNGGIRAMAPTVTTLSIASSATFSLLVAFIASYVAEALGAPEATGVIRLMAVAILVAGFSAVPSAILQREFRQDHKLLADAIGFVVSTAVVIALALAHFGPWALAWSRIAGNLSAALVMIVLTKERYWPGFDRQIAREVLSFSLPLAGASLLVLGAMNVDYIVIGAILGPLQLGLYLLAFNLASWPVNAFSSSIRSVSLAGFAQLRQDEGRMQSGFSRSLALLMAVTLPACVLLAAFSMPLIRFIYGERWLPAAAALAVLSVLGAVRVALELAYDYLAAAGRTRAILLIHLIWTIGLVPSLIIGADVGGIEGVGWGHVAIVIILVIPAYLRALGLAGVEARSLLGGLVRPLVGGAVMTLSALAISRVLETDFLRLAVGGTMSLAAYVAIVLPMRKNFATGPDGAT